MDWTEGLDDRRHGARRLEEGWRWERDVLAAELAVELAPFIEQYGSNNVLVGPGNASDHGVYVRDLDALLNELKEDILNFEMGHPINDDGREEYD